MALTVKLERVESGRWLVKSPEGNRLGEVFGGRGYFQAQTMRGERVGEAGSRIKAADLLYRRAQAAQTAA